MTGAVGRGTNTGHGHVWERPDGVKARCDGPALCDASNRTPEQAAEKARLYRDHYPEEQGNG